jgi:hypothetical protein
VSLPWKTILFHGPTILEAARTLYAAARKSTGADGESGERAADGVDEVRRALDRIEERELQQAALLADLAKQVQDVTVTVDLMRARLRVALVGASLAVALAIVSIVLSLSR